MVPESARWGDGALNNPATYTRDTNWVIERNWVLNTLMPQRSAIVLQQLRDAGLYPTVPPDRAGRWRVIRMACPIYVLRHS